MANGPWLVTLGESSHRLRCWVCQGVLFFDREVKLNSSGAELFNMGWANQSATGLICRECGYVHLVAAGAELWRPEGGYPAGPAEADDRYR
jgi:hypothetical protein